jgi:hypothetical protein
MGHVDVMWRPPEGQFCTVCPTLGRGDIQCLVVVLANSLEVRAAPKPQFATGTMSCNARNVCDGELFQLSDIFVLPVYARQCEDRFK